MKTQILYAAVLLLALITASCENEETLTKSSGRVNFSFDAKTISSGRAKDGASPAFILLSVQTAAGVNVFENKKLELFAFGNGFVTENISLETGAYAVTSFVVLDEGNEALYATPKTGSPKAELVVTPLPITFTVTADNAVALKPEVVAVSSTDSPAQFGYASFGFDVVETDQIGVSIKVELTVGKINYVDVDTKVKIAGFNSDNVQQWANEYAYVGPEANTFKVKRGFHHYELTISHWGITDRQIVSGEHLVESASGSVPTTFVLGGARQPKKLSHYITYIERPDPANWGQTTMEPESFVEYQYRTDGKLDKMSVKTYDKSTHQFLTHRYFDFTYIGDRVDQLKGYHPGETTPYVQDFYFYNTGGNVSKIREENTGSGINSEVDIAYNYTDRLITATYSFSNGTGFQYEFNFINKNITKDKIVRAGTLCSTGNYTYDKNINPLAHLGYTDFLLRNYSVNNRIGESVNYLGCAFPTLIPEAYEYQYDSEGFPTQQTIRYKGSNLVMMTKYFYQ